MSAHEIIGTVVGITNPREFYFSITPNKVKVQDFVCVETFLNKEIETSNKNSQQDSQSPTEDTKEKAVVWAKIMDIERINPLFPTEAGHELAFSQTSAFDTVISLSREMITAKCKILGTVNDKGEIQNLNYPLQPASSVFLPQAEAMEQFLIGQLADHRKLNIGTLRSRQSQPISIDAHAIVARHLAVLASTGAGKTVAVRKIIEELMSKNYPILILDKHGDYVNLKSHYKNRVKIYKPALYLKELDNDLLIQLINSLSNEELSSPQESLLLFLFRIYNNNDDFIKNCITHLSNQKYKLNISSHHFYGFLELLNVLAENDDIPYKDYNIQPHKNLGTSATPLRRILFRCAEKYKQMKEINSRFSDSEYDNLPKSTEMDILINKGQISIITLEGYDEGITQAVTAIVINKLKEYRIIGKETWSNDGGKKKKEVKIIDRFLTIVEEAHNYISSESDHYNPCKPLFKQIASEGRKYGMGLVVISQRPSRIDSTILSQCNSYIILKIVNPADQSYIRSLVESLGEDEAKILPDLTVGEALLTGQFVKFPVLVKIEPGKATSKHVEEDFIIGFASKAENDKQS